MKKLLISLTLLLAFSFLFFACAPGNIMLKVNPANSGTAQVIDNGNGSYTIVATANQDWRFDQWTGDYSGYINNSIIIPSGPMTITANFVEHTVQEISYDFENQSLDGWTLGGAENPHIQGDYHATIGNYAVQFGQVEPVANSESVPLDDSEESYMSISNVSLTQGTKISFDYKVSSEVGSSIYDYLGLYIDNGTDPVSGRLGGEIDWTAFEYEVAATGIYKLTWKYYKDGSQSEGLDCAWVDNIKMVTMPPIPKIQVSVAKDTTVTPKGKVGEEKILSYTIKNIGGADLHIAPVTITGTQFTITQQPDVLLAPGASTAVKLSVTPTAADAHYQTKVTILSSDHENSPYSFNIDLVGVDTAPGWLFMMFMAGNSGLGNALWQDVNEMEHGLYLLQEAGQSIDNMKILVLFDGESSSHPDNMLYELGPESTVNTAASSNTLDLSSEKWWTGDVDTGNGATVTAFVQWAEARYPGYTNKMLMLSNHGGGPDKGNGEDDELLKYVCSDNSSGNHMRTSQVRVALENAGYNESNKLTVFGMDACLMGNIEESYEYRNLVEYFVVSPETEPGDGWEFDYWLPNITDSSLAEEVVYQIVLSYKQKYSPSETLTAVNLSKMEDLKTAINTLATSITSNGESSAAKTAFNNSNGYYYSYLREFGKFCANIESGSFSSATKSAAAGAKNALGEAVVYAYAGTGDGNYEGYGSDIKKGLSIVGTSQSWYSSLQFSTGNAWTSLINSW